MAVRRSLERYLLLQNQDGMVESGQNQLNLRHKRNFLTKKQMLLQEAIVEFWEELKTALKF